MQRDEYVIFIVLAIVSFVLGVAEFMTTPLTSIGWFVYCFATCIVAIKCHIADKK